MPWPVKTIKVEGYGWTIQYRDPSVKEILAWNKALSETNETAAMSCILALVKAWDCKDIGDNLLPVSAESFETLPVIVKLTAVKMFRGEGDPKATIAG